MKFEESFNEFKKCDSEIFCDNTGLWKYKDYNFNLYLKKSEIDNYQETLKKKGDCSTTDAAQRIFDGDIYNSHALPFYLYNLSGLRQIERFIPKEDMSKMTFFELGCNTGYVARMLNRNNFKFKEYWGMDFDFAFIWEGYQQHNKQKDTLFDCNFITGNFNDGLNFKDESFDFIWFQEAFDHCEDRFFYSESLLTEILRVMKKESLLYLTLTFDSEYRQEGSWKQYWDHAYCWPKDEFDAMIQDYFEIVQFSPLLSFSQEVPHSISDIWPEKFAKLISAPFVNQPAVGSYLLRKL